MCVDRTNHSTIIIISNGHILAHSLFHSFMSPAFCQSIHRFGSLLSSQPNKSIASLIGVHLSFRLWNRMQCLVSNQTDLTTVDNRLWSDKSRQIGTTWANCKKYNSAGLWVEQNFSGLFTCLSKQWLTKWIHAKRALLKMSTRDMLVVKCHYIQVFSGCFG